MLRTTRSDRLGWVREGRMIAVWSAGTTIVSLPET
jgi:hypothetical protein